MKKTLTYILAFAAILAVSCKQEYGVTTPVNTPAIDVTTQKLDPAADESGAVRAFIGTEVTAHGFNLELVSKVTVDDVEAEIVSKEFKTLKFKIPALSFAQNDDPYKVVLKVFDADGETSIFRYDYYVTVPVTDALVSGFAPKEGTVGQEVTISGRNLSQITAVTVAGQNATIGDITDDAVKITIPPVPSATAAVTNVDIAATWSGGTIDVTADEYFALNIPVFAAYTQSGNAVLGDEIALTGENLDLASGFAWGETALLVIDQSATAVTLKIPTGIEAMSPAVQSKDLTAVYGTPAQNVTIVSGFALDTTPIGPAAPVFASVENADAAYGTSFYLNKELIVKGENFASVEGFKVDGITVSLTQEATDVDAHFIVPSTITGTAEKEVSLVALWNGGNELDCGTITVYPFYYTKGLRLGKGCGAALYTDFDSANAFLLLDEGKVVSADEWSSRPVDPACTSSGNALVIGGSKIAAGKEAEYYACAPYIFMSVTSNTQLQFNNPANSTSQLKNHRLSDLSTALPAFYGTPVVMMGAISDEAIVADCAAGTLSDINVNTAIYGTSAPRWDQHWVKGGVLGIQYVGYDRVSTNGGKAGSLADVRKTGFLYIRDITMTREGGPGSGTKIESGGYVEVDLYWSNVLE